MFNMAYTSAVSGESRVCGLGRKIFARICRSIRAALYYIALYLPDIYQKSIIQEMSSPVEIRALAIRSPPNFRRDLIATHTIRPINRLTMYSPSPLRPHNRSIFSANARNYSIYAIPTAWFLSQIISPSSSAFCLHSKVESKQADVTRRGEVYRDSMETFPLFALSMVVGNEAGLDSGTLNFVAVGYVIARGVYTSLELCFRRDKQGYFRFVDRGKGGNGRSAAWWTGNLLCLYPLIKGGNVLAKFS
jgi:MAPEG family